MGAGLVCGPITVWADETEQELRSCGHRSCSPVAAVARLGTAPARVDGCPKEAVALGRER